MPCSVSSNKYPDPSTRFPRVIISTLFLCGFFAVTCFFPSLSFAAPTSKPVKVKTKAAPVPQPEQIKLYVPYRKLGKVLNNQGVFLTKKQFERMMSEIRQLRRKQKQALPVNYLLTQTWYEGVFSGKSVKVKAVLELRLLKDKMWIPVSLPFSGLPLLSATLNDKPAMVFSPQNNGKGYVMLARGQGTHRLVLTFSGRTVRTVGGFKWSMKVPPTPQTQIKFRWRGGPWRVSAMGRDVEVNAKTNVYTESVGPQSLLQATWQPKQQVQTTSKRLLSSKHFIEALVEQGMLQTRARFKVRVVRGKVGKLQIALPDGHQLIGVDVGKLLKQWSIVKKNKQRVLQLFLRKQVTGTVNVQLELESLRKTKSKKVSIPSFSVLNAKWQHGVVGVRTIASLHLNVDSFKGLTQIDPEEYVRRSKAVSPSLAFAYLSPNYSLQLSMKQVLPRVRAEVTHLVGLESKQAFVETLARYKIERAGVFRFKFKVPKGWTLRDVKCPNQRDHFVQKGELVVVLKQRVGGPQLVQSISRYQLWRYYKRTLGRRFFRQISRRNGKILIKRLHRKSAIRRLVRLFGNQQFSSSSSVTCKIKLHRRIKGTSLAIPFVKPLGVENERGKVGIFVADHLDLETKNVKGLLSLDDLSEFRGVKVAKHNIRQGFRYVGRPISGTLTWKRKKTVVAAEVWQPVKLRDDGYKVDGAVRYQARYSSTKSIKLEIPASIGKSFRIVSDTREVRKKKGKKVWTYSIVLNDKIPRNGSYLLRFSYLTSFKKAFEVGQTKSLSLASIRVPGAFRQTTMWGFQKEESISLSMSAAAGFERIDSSDLPKFAKGLELTKMVRTRSSRPTLIQVELRKHKYAKVLAATVMRLHVEMAASLNGDVHVLAVAKVRNRGRQFLTLGLPKGSEVVALRVAGRNRYRFELNKKGNLLVDLQYRTKGRPFWVVVRYKYKLNANSKIAGLWGNSEFGGPVVKDTPVLHTSLQLYLPPRFSYVSFASPMEHKNNRVDVWTLVRTLLWARRYSSYHRIFDIYQMRNVAGDLSSQFPRRGASFQFASDDAKVTATATFRRTTIQNILEFVVALLSFFFLLAFRRKEPSFNRSVRLLVGAFVFFGFVGALVPDAWVTLSYSAIIGSASAGGLWSVFWVFGGLRSMWNGWMNMKSQKNKLYQVDDLEDKLESSGAHKVDVSAAIAEHTRETPPDAPKDEKTSKGTDGDGDDSKEESP